MSQKPALPAKPTMTEGQRAYESRRAARAGMSLDKWLAQKDREAADAVRAQARAAEQARRAEKKPGILSRLLDRAHKPL
jgi:hypothetical protein